MLRSFVFAGAALAAIAAAPLAAQPAPTAVTAPAIEFSEWKLANGLTVIAIPDPTTANVMTSMWYDVGSKNDPEGRSGFAHLFEHILSRKTENMPYNMINRLTEDVGGQRNASTDVVVFNQGAATDVTVTLLFEDGPEATATFPVAAGARFAVPMAEAFPAAAGRKFSVLVEGADASANLVVDRAIYWQVTGTTRTAGADGAASRLR